MEGSEEDGENILDLASGDLREGRIRNCLHFHRDAILQFDRAVSNLRLE